MLKSLATKANEKKMVACILIQYNFILLFTFVKHTLEIRQLMKLPRSEPDFVLSQITRPRWLELPIARTDFDSPFEFEPAKFYCTIFKRGGNSTLFLL
jgi:hypothetical protein